MATTEVIPVAGMSIKGKATITPAAYDIDDIKFYSLTNIPNAFYRKMIWNGNEQILYYITDAGDGYSVTVYENGAWVDERCRNVRFANDCRNLTTEEAAWLATIFDPVSALDYPYLIYKSELTAVANAIRAKSGSSAELSWPDDFISAIDNL